MNTTIALLCILSSLPRTASADVAVRYTLTIDEVRVFGRALALEEIAKLMIRHTAMVEVP